MKAVILSEAEQDFFRSKLLKKGGKKVKYEEDKNTHVFDYNPETNSIDLVS